MLRKLLKYEFQATARLCLPIFAGYILISTLMALGNKFAGDSFVFMILFLILSLGFFALNTVNSIVPLFINVTRFSKNLLGEEGYLMNTLPVTARQHVISKVIVSSVWYIASAIASVLGAVVMYASNESYANLMKYINIIAKDILKGFKENPLLCVLIILLCFSASICSVLMINASICLGHRSNSGRGIKAVLYFFGMTIAIAIIFALFIDIMDSLDITKDLTGFEAGNLIVGSMLVGSLIIGGIFYWITESTLTKKLNLQ